MKIINLTAHTLNELISGTEIKPSGIIARVHKNDVKVREYKRMPIYETTYGELLGLPEPVKDTLYIVSAMALNAVPAGRTDVVSPGYVKRDENGVTIGCIGFKTK